MDTLGEGPGLPKVRPRKLMDEGISGCLDLGAQLALHCSLNFETTGVSRASFWKEMQALTLPLPWKGAGGCSQLSGD